MGGFFASAFGSMMNSANTKQTNEANLKIAQDVNQQNRRQFEENMAWQKSENELMRQREDNSIQRRQADLEKAGINPLLAGLGGATAQLGQIVNATPMQGATMQKSDAGNIIANMDSANLSDKVSRIVATGADARLKNAQAEKTLAEVPNVSKAGLIADEQLKNLQSDTLQKDQQTRNLEEARKNMVVERGRIASDTVSNILGFDKTKAETENTRENTLMQRSQRELNAILGHMKEWEIEKIKAEIPNIMADTERKSKSTEYMDKLIQKAGTDQIRDFWSAVRDGQRDARNQNNFEMEFNRQNENRKNDQWRRENEQQGLTSQGNKKPKQEYNKPQNNQNNQKKPYQNFREKAKESNQKAMEGFVKYKTRKFR